MVIVIKYFTDRYDNLKPYSKGDKHDFGKERNEYLVKHGYAEWNKEIKVLNPEIKTKPVHEKVVEVKSTPKRRKK